VIKVLAMASANPLGNVPWGFFMPFAYLAYLTTKHETACKAAGGHGWRYGQWHRHRPEMATGGRWCVFWCRWCRYGW